MTDRREFMKYASAAAITASTIPAGRAATGKQMTVRPIPGTDESLAVVGLGNSRAFRADDLGVARELIGIFLDHGGRYVDVGGPSRVSVGRIGKDMDVSDALFLGNYLDPRGLEEMRADVKTVAKAQGKQALDLIHARNAADYRARYDNYRVLKEEGLVRYIGIARSGHRYHEAIEALVEDDLVDFIQTNYSLVEPEAAERLLPVAQDNGVAVVINRPFINGDYFSIVRGKKLPEWTAEFDCESWAQFSLKFILAHPAVSCVLTETANPKHAIDNLGAGSGRLPDEATRRRMLALINSFL